MKPIVVVDELGNKLGRATVLTDGPGGVVVQMLLSNDAKSIKEDPEGYIFQLMLKNGE